MKQLFRGHGRRGQEALCSQCQAGTTDLATQYATLRTEVDAAAAAKAAADELERLRQAAAECERRRKHEEQERLRRAFDAMQAERDAAHLEHVASLAQNVPKGGATVAAQVRVHFGDVRNPEWEHRQLCLGEFQPCVPKFLPRVSVGLQTVTSAGISDDHVWKCNQLGCTFARRMTSDELESRRASRLIEEWEEQRGMAIMELRRQRIPWTGTSGDVSTIDEAADAGEESGDSGAEDGQGTADGDQGGADGGGAPGLGSLSRVALKRLCDANQLMITGKKDTLRERLRLAMEHGRAGVCPRCGYSQLDLVCAFYAPDEPCRVECRHWRGQNDRCGWQKFIDSESEKRAVLWMPLVDSRERDLLGVGIDAPITPHGPRQRSSDRLQVVERSQRAWFRENEGAFGVNFNALDDEAGAIAGPIASAFF